MKRTISLLLAVIMLFALTACSKKAEPVDEPAGSEAAEAAPEVVVNTTILKEADDNMINTYSLLAVNPEAPFVDADGNAVSDVAINTVGAAALINWMLSEEGETAAANYGVD